MVAYFMNRFRRQALFLCDTVMFIALMAFFYWFSQRYYFWSPKEAPVRLLENLLLLYGCTALFELIFRTYDSLWRYAESREYLMLLSAAGLGFALYEVISRAVLKAVIPFLLLTSVAGTWVLGMLMIRIIYRYCRSYRNSSDVRQKRPVALVGAGAAGVQMLEEIQNNPDSPYSVQCFFDDDPGKIGRRIHGVVVKAPVSQMRECLRAMSIENVIVAIPSLSEKRRQEILAELSGMNHIRVSVLPGTLDLLEGRTIRSQLREVQIEDLLGRSPVQLDPTPVDAYLSGKVVLITGGGGSIGSELCRQVAKRHPKRLVIVDIYENNAYDIQQELRYQYGSSLDLRVEIASIRDRERVEQLFSAYRPDVVFHAAAHKHVPLMETSPQEAVRNNVFGTRNLVWAADRCGVKKFVQISTDKAVNPTNVMGATKRLCEMILQSMKGRSATTFAAVRFGNVLGSNGSVVPLFQKQIRAGGPVTITDKRIIRYFMTIPEAAQLVLQAGAMARQNELYVLDMGQPVKILDLAENMIRLSGYIPYRDIDVVETGLRPGEKLYEELLINSRDIEKTEHNLIFVERQPSITEEELEHKLALLDRALQDNDPAAVRLALHQVVPTFREPEEVNKAKEEMGVPADKNGAPSCNATAPLSVQSA